MSRIWSEEGKLARWLEVELAALEGWAELGAIPADDVAAIRARRDGTDAGARRRDRAHDRPRHRRLRRRRRRAARARGPLAPLRAHLLRRRRHRARRSRSRTRASCSSPGSTARSPRWSRQAEEHRRSICIGRTHGIHAEPTTFGWKLAGWAFELDRDRDAPRAGARVEPRRPALGHGRHLRRPRPRGRARRLRAARASSPTRSRRR